jgi:hypothetical protein
MQKIKYRPTFIATSVIHFFLWQQLRRSLKEHSHSDKNTSYQKEKQMFAMCFCGYQNNCKMFKDFSLNIRVNTHQNLAKNERHN